MVDIINGGVYAVDLGGTETYEFKGVHPALIIRTLKEEKMYFVIPLTTYTKERWEKCKRKGFGARLLSTNSIARVDKLNIVSEKQIRGRYYNAGRMVIPSEEELKAVYEKFEEYIVLTDKKAQKEYEKYIFQKDEFERETDLLFDVNRMRSYSYKFCLETKFVFCYPLTKLSRINYIEMKEILNKKVYNQGITFKKCASDLEIEISMPEEKLLTFKNEYDKFKSQKGSSNM